MHSAWSDGSTARASTMFMGRFRFGARRGGGAARGSERPQLMHSAPTPASVRLSAPTHV